MTLSEKIRRGEDVPFPIGLALGLLTPFTRLGMWWRLLWRPVKVSAYVISFGNLTAGGTGKTPAVIERAQAEIEKGKTVAVLTRGYGAPDTEKPLSSPNVPPGERAEMLGDEPALILERVPDVYVVKFPDRVAAAREAIKKFQCDVLILDDGFQNVRLHRDENVLLIDASDPFGNGHVLPRGVLREPLTAMKRATHVVLTRCDQAEDLPALEATVRRHAPNAPIRKTIHQPTGLIHVGKGKEVELAELKTGEWTAACAIGNPESFFATLRGLGATLTETIALPDHADDIEEYLPDEGRVVVTEKDAVRLGEAGRNVYALRVALADFV